MTELLEEAFATVARLPDHEHDAFARWLLDELESERRWSRAFEAAQDQLAELARDGTIRIISARAATKRERHDYEQGARSS